MRIFENLHLDYLSKRKIFYIISTSLFLIGLLNVIFRGLVFGIDFKGGTEIVLQFDKPVQISQIRQDVNNIGLGIVELKTFGSETGVLIRTELQNVPPGVFPSVVKNVNDEIQSIYPGLPLNIVDSSANSVTYEFANPDTTNILTDRLFSAGFQTSKVSEEPDNKKMIVSVGIADWIKENLKKKIQDNGFKVIKEDHVGPKVGKELKQDAVIAVVLSLAIATVLQSTIFLLRWR